MSQLGNLLSQIRLLQQGGPPLLPVPTQPMPVNPNLTGGRLRQAQQRALRNLQRQQAQIQQSNQQLLAAFQAQQNQAKQQLFQFGLSQATTGLGNLQQPGVTAATGLAGALGALGGTAIMAGSALGGPGGAALAVGGLATKFASVLVESTDGLRKFARELLNTNFRFAEFSGSMAIVQAEQQVRDIARSQRMGDVRAPSTQRLAEAMSRLNNTLEPLDNTLNIVINETLTDLLNKVNAVIKIMELVSPVAMAIVNSLNKPKALAGDFDKWLDQQGKDWAAKHGLPSRFQPPMGF